MTRIFLPPKALAASMAAGVLSFGAPAQAADTLATANAEIRNSLCVGPTCTTAVDFFDSTLLLKSNVIKVKFDDTSTSSGFSGHDWELEINSDANGGPSYFGINDCGSQFNDGGCADDLVFAIEAGARYGALYVDQTGNVGLGTTDPGATLELVSGNFPAIRLRQDTSSGFTPYTWEVGANETFAIQDIIAVQAPFQILPGSKTDALVIDPDGVGIGLAFPSELLHVYSGDGSGKMLVEVGTVGLPAPRFVATFLNNGASAVEMIDLSGGTSFWAFQSISTGPNLGDATFMLTNSFGPGDEFVLQADGDLFITGSLTQMSDRNAKMAIEPVDPAEILAKVSALPVAAWTYKNDTSGARHLGPMAQDFHALFGLGESETGISTLDSSGVALAAIKALAEENAAQDARIKELMALSARLAARLEDMETARQ